LCSPHLFPRFAHRAFAAAALLQENRQAKNRLCPPKIPVDHTIGLRQFDEVSGKATTSSGHQQLGSNPTETGSQQVALILCLSGRGRRSVVNRMSSTSDGA
jgi:hypothetical protein